MNESNETPSAQPVQEEVRTTESDRKVAAFPFPVKAERKKVFECSDCGLNEEYDYYGKTPPFCRAIVFLDDSYVARDPFTAQKENNANFLLLGSNCAICSKMTCQECSIFFTKRFCCKCSKAMSAQLPEELTKKKAID